MSSHKYIRDTGILNTDKNRFYFNIAFNSDNDCMEWKGTKKKNGYGQFETLNKKWVHAHRHSYSIFNGKIPQGICVLHKCDNRICVNPEHLFLGTKKDNTQDMINKGRRGVTSLKGEKNHKSKLLESDVIKIRNLYSKGKNCTQIALIYNLSISAIDRIVRKISWKHI